MLFDSGCLICAASPGPVCSRCARQLTHATGPGVAGLDVCRSQYVLDDWSRVLVAAMKYRGERRLAEWFASRAYHQLPRAADVVTWLPATPEQRCTRGFDQAAEFARSLARLTGVPARPLLHRHRSDERQTGQSRVARLVGPTLSSLCPSPNFVVLVDDVITTGSSMRVAARVLRSAGAQRIVGLTIATTPLTN